MENLKKKKKKSVWGRRNSCFLNSSAYCCPHTKLMFHTVLGTLSFASVHPWCGCGCARSTRNPKEQGVNK